MKLSCIFAFEKRVYDRNGEPVLLDDGKTIKTNWNYLNLLQVISAYWELRDDGKNQLNVFLNGGSVVVDHNTGERISKAGFTMVLPEFLGLKFQEQMFEWGESFGLTAPQRTAPSYQTGTNTNRTTQPGNNQRPASRGRAVREDDFVDPNAPLPQAKWEEESPAV